MAVRANGDRYLAMLNEFLFTKIDEENVGNIWFQQHGLRAIQLLDYYLSDAVKDTKIKKIKPLAQSIMCLKIEPVV